MRKPDRRSSEPLPQATNAGDVIKKASVGEYRSVEAEALTSSVERKGFEKLRLEQSLIERQRDLAEEVGEIDDQKLSEARVRCTAQIEALNPGTEDYVSLLLELIANAETDEQRVALTDALQMQQEIMRDWSSIQRNSYGSPSDGINDASFAGMGEVLALPDGTIRLNAGANTNQNASNFERIFTGSVITYDRYRNLKYSPYAALRTDRSGNAQRQNFEDVPYGLEGSVLRSSIELQRSLDEKIIQIESMLNPQNTTYETMGEDERLQLNSLKNLLLSLVGKIENLPPEDPNKLRLQEEMLSLSGEFTTSIRSSVRADIKKISNRARAIEAACDSAEMMHGIVEGIAQETANTVLPNIGGPMYSLASNVTHVVTGAKTGFIASTDFAIDCAFSQFHSGVAGKRFAKVLRKSPAMKPIVEHASRIIQKLKPKARSLTFAVIQESVEDMIAYMKGDGSFMELIADICSGELTSEDVEALGNAQRDKRTEGFLQDKVAPKSKKLGRAVRRFLT